MYKSNYDKYPSVPVNGAVWQGWDSIVRQLGKGIEEKTGGNYILAVECYHGVHHEELIAGFKLIPHELFINTADLFRSEKDILEMTYPDVTDDEIFGYITRLSLSDFFDKGKVNQLKDKIKKTNGVIIIYGYGASLISEKNDLLIYADMPRWEIQLRQRRNEINNIGISNKDESPALQYKRGYFVDWRVCDRLKKSLFSKAGYWLDTVTKGFPKMIEGKTLLEGLENTVMRPFRVVPFFDPGPWGGQWMKEICGLDKQVDNYAWCFDCVPEENSLLLNISGTTFEIPSINLVFYKTRELLGGPVESRFGREFPIRFDFLDTMNGGNLSLQVHPTTQYIREQFGMPYTQDESYYILDAGPGAEVYLGLKDGINPKEMIDDLKEARDNEIVFDADKYVNKFSAKKHDHFLIPNGTVHCSGANGMVLEISATPYIFTFKLWDWGRPGLDGKPRPINIRHGSEVIQWNRDTEYCRNNLVNRTEKISEGDGWIEERTGLHENEFIETRRHWFTNNVEHNTGGSVNVLNLVEGREAIVESPDNKFEPFVIHYAETFIVPASVSKYTIRPYGESEGKQCATVKAYVRYKG
jgi:mannose-6-phosphate isomerase class I